MSEYEALLADRQTSVRASLTTDDFYTLLTFTRRSALAALRGNPASAREGVVALTATDAQRVDWRDVTVAAALLSYALGREGDPRSPFLEAAEGAEATVAEILRRFAREPATSLRPWGFREVETADGMVLFEDWGHPFRPTVDLTAVALSVAGVLAADVYRVTSIGVGSDLPTVWLGGGRPAAPLAGCVVIHAALAPSQQLTVFLGEAATAEDAAAIASASATASALPHEALALSHERVCCLVIARSFVEGVPAFEQPGALQRFRLSLETLLTRSVT